MPSPLPLKYAHTNAHVSIFVCTYVCIYTTELYNHLLNISTSLPRYGYGYG